MASVKPNGQLNVGTQTTRLQGSAETKSRVLLRGLSQNWRILTSLSLYQRLFFLSEEDFKIRVVQVMISVGNFHGISGLHLGLWILHPWKYLEWIESPCLVFVNQIFQLGSRSKFRTCWHSWQLFQTISKVGPCSSKDLLHRRNYLIGNETLFFKASFLGSM